MNDILEIIRRDPDILRRITQLPELNTRQLFPLEREVFDNIERQAFARRVFRENSYHSKYYRHLSHMHRNLLRIEISLMSVRFALIGMELYNEVARVYNLKCQANLSGRQAKAELEYASEILTGLEDANYTVHRLKEMVSAA